MPRFSIVIPSRNRADLALSALQSVLEQDFRDFEVIVSDNSDEDESKALFRALQPFSADPRFRYIKPQRPLPMTAHWEWAVAHATGEYVGILTDRMILRLYTLSTVDAVIARGGPELVAYERTNLIETGTSFAVPKKGSGAAPLVTIRKTAPIIEAFSRSDFSPMDTPRFLNSFVSATFLDHLRSEYGSVFTGVAPDYGFLMRVLDQIDEFPFIETPLLIKHSEDRSNGKSFTHYNLDKAGNDFIAFSRSEQGEFLKFSPVPDDLVMITNVMMREYEIGRHNQRRGHFPNFEKQAFYNESLRHLMVLKREGKNVALLLDRMEKYRAENGLSSYRLSSRERRKHIRAKIRRILGFSPRKRKPKLEGQTFPTIIDALRIEAQERRNRLVLSNEELVSFG
ncbi:glycosyltransferase family A protein [Sinorhizobium sp. 8-89]|uniref:glycosyltransferase family 2 protein n=1 Tax=Sinorhizobium sp. 7-81 TaxID=3049087 RepID=UPI0024C3ADB0|nr:glycosyltransferase family A protein [Sinorhizobium sp. 7-81]MDK1386803.1 glycosyltransferase family A protein [Sinorhizobium sp. 7-81]